MYGAEQQPADVNSIENEERNENKKKTVSLLLLSSVIHSSILLNVRHCNATVERK